MRNTTLLLAIVAAVAVSGSALAQNAKTSKPQPSVAEADRANANDNSFRLLKDGLPLFMPSAVSIYMLHRKSQDAKQTDKPAR